VPDVHVPKLGEQHGAKSVVHIALEVILISAGVFLGLAGEQWRESARHRELSHEAMQRFRTEIVENRKAVAAVTDYHVTLQKALDTEFRKPSAKRTGENIQFHGIRPATFDHAAWDLALGTQSLSYIDSDLALSLSSIYNLQDRIAEMTRGVMQAMYISPPTDDKNTMSFFSSVLVYYCEMTIFEPRLLKLYDDILPQLDKALGESSGSAFARQA
jgi:hypothetical protein